MCLDVDLGSEWFAPHESSVSFSFIHYWFTARCCSKNYALSKISALPGIWPLELIPTKNSRSVCLQDYIVP